MQTEFTVPAMTTKPWDHQVEAFTYAAPRPYSLLRIKMGGGKTLTTMMLRKAWDAKSTLIVCPKHVISTWVREFMTHDHTEAGPWVLPREKGTLQRFKESAERAAMIKGRVGGFVIVMNYDSVWRLPFGPWLLGRNWDLVVCDESQRIKGHDSKVSQFMHMLQPKTRRRLCLTGTPLYHSQLDIFGQARFLDPGIFGWSYHRFQGRYAKFRPHTIVNRGGNKQQIQIVSGYRNEAELKNRMENFTYTPSFIDETDWPDSRDQTFTCELPSSARKIYRQLCENLQAEIEDGTVTVGNSLIATLRLRQLVAGHLPIDQWDSEDDSDRVKTIHRAKAKLLKEVLMDIDSPVTVFSHFKHDFLEIEKVAKELGRRYGEVSGRANDLDGDQYPAGVDILGVQYQSGGSGVNLQNRCHHAIYYTPTYSSGDFDQSRARLKRPGQKAETVIFTHLLVNDTIDPVVQSALLTRCEVNQALVDSLKKGVK